MNVRKSVALQLIAPIQVKLKTNVEINLVEFTPGQIVTLEKHQAVSLIRAGKAESLNDGVDRARSANMYTVKEVAKAAAQPERAAKADSQEDSADKPKERK